VSSSLVAYAQALPVSSSATSRYDLVTFVGDLISHAKAHLTLNATVIPVLQTFNILIGREALDRLHDNTEGLKKSVPIPEDNQSCLAHFFSLQRILTLALRNVARLRNVERILESMML